MVVAMLASLPAAWTYAASVAVTAIAIGKTHEKGR